METLQSWEKKNLHACHTTRARTTRKAAGRPHEPEDGSVIQPCATHLPRDDNLLRVHVPLCIRMQRKNLATGAGDDATLYAIHARTPQNQACFIRPRPRSVGKTTTGWPCLVVHHYGSSGPVQAERSYSKTALTPGHDLFRPTQRLSSNLRTS